MKKRISAFLLTLIMCFTLVSAAASSQAAVAPKNVELRTIVVRTPYFPDLEITMTNAPRFCVEKSMVPGAPDPDVAKQIKFFYTDRTTIKLNMDVSFLGRPELGESAVMIKAGEVFKPARYTDGTFGTFLAVSNDGAISFGDSALSGRGVYNLAFIKVGVYKTNVEREGYTAVDILDWEVVDKNNPTTKPVHADYDADGDPDYTYYVSGVQKTAKIRIAELSKLEDPDPAVAAIAGRELPLYTIKTGEKIFIPEALDCYFAAMKYKDKSLVYRFSEYESDNMDWSTFIKRSDQRIATVELGSGFSYNPCGKNAYVSFPKEGYYIFSVVTYVSKHLNTDIMSPDWGEFYEDQVHLYNAVVLHIVE